MPLSAGSQANSHGRLEDEGVRRRAGPTANDERKKVTVTMDGPSHATSHLVPNPELCDVANALLVLLPISVNRHADHGMFDTSTNVRQSDATGTRSKAR
jgi:hypothetical protein